MGQAQRGKSKPAQADTSQHGKRHVYTIACVMKRMSEATIPAGSRVGGRDNTIGLFTPPEGTEDFGQRVMLLRLWGETVPPRNAAPSDRNAVVTIRSPYFSPRGGTRLLHNYMESGDVVGGRDNTTG